MKRIDPTATIRPTPEANGYLIEEIRRDFNLL